MTGAGRIVPTLENRWPDSTLGLQELDLGWEEAGRCDDRRLTLSFLLQEPYEDRVASRHRSSTEGHEEETGRLDQRP